MPLVQRTVCKCIQCGYEWLPKHRAGVWDCVTLPAKCANPKCMRRTWHAPFVVPRTCRKLQPVARGDCILAPSESMARTLRFRVLGTHLHGMTADSTCGDVLCFADKHVISRPWKNIKGTGKWTPLAEQIGALKVGASLDYPYDNSHSGKKRLRGGVQATYAGRLLRLQIRSQSGGVRITRMPDWGRK
jgi:hypothetical protein